MIKSMKFGGTSMGDASSILKCANIVKSNLVSGTTKTIVTVSAVSGVTNRLLLMSEQVNHTSLIRNNIEALSIVHDTILKQIISDREEQKQIWFKYFVPILKELELTCYRNDNSEAKFKAQVCSFGERLSSLLMLNALQKIGIKSSVVESGEMIKTDDNYLNASVDFTLTQELIKRRLHDLLEDNTTPVVTGFIGQNTAEETTLLGRGGSDYTAAIISSALESDRLEIWTDVNGIMSTDPRLCSNAYPLEQINSELMLEISCNGAKVLDYKTVLLSIRKNIPIYVYNTFNTDFRGSCVSNSIRNNSETITSIVSSTKKVLVDLKLPADINTVNSILVSNSLFPSCQVYSKLSYKFILDSHRLSSRLKEKLDKSAYSTSYIDELTQLSIIGSDVGNSTTMIQNIFNKIKIPDIPIHFTYITPDNISIFISYNSRKKIIEQVHNLLEK